jgi:excisionase family DNA binding protein
MVNMNAGDEKGLTLSVSEACQLLGISRGSLYQGIHSGEIPSFRVGHRYVIPRAPLERILDATTSYKQKDSS